MPDEFVIISNNTIIIHSSSLKTLLSDLKKLRRVLLNNCRKWNSSMNHSASAPPPPLLYSLISILVFFKHKINASSSSSTVELERLISDAQGVLYYGAHTLSELLGFYRCPTLSKNGNGLFVSTDEIIISFISGCTIICSFDRTSTSSVTNSIT